MATPALSRELCEEAFALVERHGDKAKASRAEGIPIGTLRNRIDRGQELYGLGGATTKTAPPGQIITGTSTLIDPQTGEERLQWVKTSAEKGEDAKKALLEAFQGLKGEAPKIQAPDRLDKDMLTVYPIADHHLGLYAWSEEAGEDYDLEIGADLLKTAMGRLVASAPPSETAIILNLGDFFHSDTSMNKTLRSGHVLDVDTRFAKVLRVGVELFRQCIEAALQKHKKVIVRCLPGNHDEHTAQALTVALSMFYYGQKKRIDIDEDPSRFFMHRFGQNMIAATHGDMLRLPDMAGFMAAHYPADWGASKHRFGFQGHIHQKSVIEKNGAVCETLNTLTAKDAWSAGMGFTSQRGMRAITYHREDGEVVRHTVTI